MGYESKIYIVDKTAIKDEDGKYYAQTIAIFNLGKARDISGRLRKKPATDCYVYADDGNTRIIEDCYGEPLTECTPEYLTGLLKLAINRDPHYSRYQCILGSLDSIVRARGHWKNVVCLHYGY